MSQGLALLFRCVKERRQSCRDAPENDFGVADANVRFARTLRSSRETGSFQIFAHHLDHAGCAQIIDLFAAQIEQTLEYLLVLGA